MWILKKDIVIPSGRCKAGTPGKEVRLGVFEFRDQNPKEHPFTYGEDEMMQFPDFFEEVKDPEPKEFTRSDMIKFAWEMSGHSMAHIEKILNEKTEKINPTTDTQPDSEKKWSDEQLMSFVTYLLLDMPNAPTMERIENEFENWKKEKGYE